MIFAVALATAASVNLQTFGVAKMRVSANNEEKQAWHNLDKFVQGG